MPQISETTEKIFLAKVFGEPITKLPEDLYIPPNALQVFLDAFSGPLDLLLYLIKKQNIDILDIPVAKITKQYMNYIEIMRQLQLELAAEYLFMAAILTEIKSKLLLPSPNVKILEIENDPRAELVKRLQEYESFKKTALDLDALPRLQRDIFRVQIDNHKHKIIRSDPNLDLQNFLLAFKNILQRSMTHNHHKINLESLSVRERMTNVLAKLNTKDFISFVELLEPKEGKLGIVVTFIAILELLKQSVIEIAQGDFLGMIHMKKLF